MTDDLNALSREELLALAEQRGVTADKRWGKAKLVEALEDVLTAPDAPAPKAAELSADAIKAALARFGAVSIAQAGEGWRVAVKTRHADVAFRVSSPDDLAAVAAELGG